MARKMNLDNDALKGVGESKAEIKRRKRQEKKLKKKVAILTVNL